MLDKEQINIIRNSVDIVDIISEYVPLTKKGNNYFGVCPFHDDHSPSMSVSKSKQIYTCFSCGATGNVFNFVMDYENIGFRETLKIIADKGGIDVDVGQVPVKKSYTNPLYEIYEISQKFYFNNLNASDGKLAKDYLIKREINEEIIKEFGIGLSLKKHNMLTTLLEKKNYDYNLLINSGLVIKNNYGYNDIYYNRIMFPLWDITGKVIGFSGRIYDNSDNSKYINTKETEIFKKGELLYNYHRAKDECRLKQTVIIMEGFMDVIRAYTVGIKNVVATMGTAVTRKQALLIKKLAKDVIICFDGDEAGAKATLACADELISIGITPKIVRLEKNMDPDDYIRKNGYELFQRKIESSINVIDFKLSFYKKDYNLLDNQETSKYLNNIIKELVDIEDDILKELTLTKLSKEFNIDIKVLKDKLSKLDNNTPIKEIKSIPIKRFNKYTKAEQLLVYYMLNNKEVIKIYNQKTVFLPTDKYRLLAKEIYYFYKMNNYIKIADFITSVSENKELMETIGEIVSLNINENYTIEEINDYICAIEEYNIKFELNRLKEQLKNEADPIKKAAFAQKMIELRRMGDKNDK